MIQRIQSLYLFLAFVAVMIMFFFPVASFYSDFYTLRLYIYEIQDLTPDNEPLFSQFFILPLSILVILIGLLAVYTVMLFKNRLKQIRITKINIFLNALLIVGIFVIYPELINRQINADPEYKTGAYFPLVSMIFLILALRGIIKDERLVRSADRLR